MTKEAAFGAEFQITISSVLTTIAQVKDIQGPDIEYDTVDVTTHDSTGGWEEHVAAVIRSGQVVLSLVYDTANAQVVSYIANMGTAQAMKIKYGNTAVDEMTFSAIPVGFSQSLPHDGSIEATLTVKPTGVVTFAS